MKGKPLGSVSSGARSFMSTCNTHYTAWSDKVLPKQLQKIYNQLTP
jgi:hypothetical protein